MINQQQKENEIIDKMLNLFIVFLLIHIMITSIQMYIISNKKSIKIAIESDVKVTSGSTSHNKVTAIVRGIDKSIDCTDENKNDIIEEMQSTVAYTIKDSESYEGYITQYTDLRNRIDINADEMNYIIDYWVGLNGNESLYSGNGQAFIDVSKQCGYDPIFLMSLACNESGWNVSSLHSGKNNPYSINMTDSNPSGGYNLGNTYYDGIVNGGLWIYENYYSKGCTNLYDMIYKGNYASAKDKWINSILSTMNKSYKLLIQYKEEKR